MSGDRDRRDGWSPDAFPERRTGDGRRAHPRAGVALAASGCPEPGVLWPVDELSVGGLFLGADVAVQPGDAVHLEVWVPGSDRPVRVDGVVTHRDVAPRAGVGVRFGDMDPSDCRVVEAWLDRLARAAGHR